MTLFSPLDLVAVSWFLIAAIGYSWFTEHGPMKERSLSAYMGYQREVWLRVLLQRELRIVDTSIVTGLQNGTAFFASASLLAIGGCFALLRSSEEFFNVIKDLPIDVSGTQTQMELKVLGLLFIFSYAFFKFGWSFRLWSYASILIGGIPLTTNTNKEKAELALQRALAMNQTAAQHFNRGLRTFFFSLGFIGWFAGPIVFIVGTTWIMLVLYHRQFHSASRLAASMGCEEKTHGN